MMDGAVTASPDRRPIGGELPLAGQPLLAIRGLSIDVQTSRGRARAVDRVDLEIRRGEIFALVGESGSGKTMTALSIMRLLPDGATISEGAILLEGEDLVGASESRMNAIRGSRVALIFQQPRAALDPTSTVGNQVSETLRLRGGVSRREAQSRAIDLLSDVGIADPRRRLHAYAHEMSGGMAQRVMMAAALSGRPALLLADEPTTSLDVTVQAQILRLLLHLRSEYGLAILLITHDLAVVASVADRIGVMYAGQIVEAAPAAALLSAPQHPYSQALVKSALLTEDSTGRLYAIPGQAPGLTRTDPGCRFVSRCPLAEGLGIRERCRAAEPPLVRVGTDRVSRCWANPSRSD